MLQQKKRIPAAGNDDFVVERRVRPAGSPMLQQKNGSPLPGTTILLQKDESAQPEVPCYDKKTDPRCEE